MTLDHIQSGLNMLEIAFKVSSPDRLAIYEQVLRRKNLTEKQMGDAVVLCIEQCKFFPSVAEILERAGVQSQLVGGRGDVMDAGQTRNWFEEQKALKAKVDAERRGGKTQSLSELLPKNGVTP